MSESDKTNDVIGFSPYGARRLTHWKSFLCSRTVPVDHNRMKQGYNA